VLTVLTLTIPKANKYKTAAINVMVQPYIIEIAIAIIDPKTETAPFKAQNPPYLK
jgi:hypothetical protein